jgi:hypothetical protein
MIALFLNNGDRPRFFVDDCYEYIGAPKNFPANGRSGESGQNEGSENLPLVALTGQTRRTKPGWFRAGFIKNSRE